MYPGTELRIVDGVDLWSVDAPTGPAETFLWAKAPALPDDPGDDEGVHQAVLAWATDGFLIATALRPHAGIGQHDAHRGLSTGVVGHTIVFHEPFRADEWLLLAHHSPYAGRGRTFGTGDVFTEDGRFVASYVQTNMVRYFADPASGRRHAVPDGHVSRLDGRVAIVTGASRGIGEAVARLFAREGAAVAVTARTEQVFDERLPGTIHDTVAAIEAEGGRAVAIRADLADDDDVDRLVDEARAALGPIDLLVNNAALTVPGRPPKAGGTTGPTGPSANAPSPARRRARRRRAPPRHVRVRSSASR